MQVFWFEASPCGVSNQFYLFSCVLLVVCAMKDLINYHRFHIWQGCNHVELYVCVGAFLIFIRIRGATIYLLRQCFA